MENEKCPTPPFGHPSPRGMISICAPRANTLFEWHCDIQLSEGNFSYVYTPSEPRVTACQAQHAIIQNEVNEEQSLTVQSKTSHIERKDRSLNFEDINHYQHIIIALTETSRLKKDIDDLGMEWYLESKWK